MTGRIWRKKQKLIVRIVCIAILLGSFIGYLAYRAIEEKEKKGRFVATIEQDCYFFPAGANEALRERTEETGDEYALLFGGAGTKLFYHKDIGYYLETAKKAVDVSMPIYQKNGATLYLSEKVRQCRFFCTDYSVERGETDVWVSCGVAFNTENTRAFSKDIFMLNFLGEAYFASNPFVLAGYAAESVRANSLLYFDEDVITVYEFYDGLLKKRSLAVSGDAMVTIGENRVSYHEFYAYCQSARVTNMPVMMKGGRLLEGNYYYFFLNQRYELHGPCVLYETKDGLFLEDEEQSYTLTNAPLYAVGESRIFLPADYMLLLYNQRLYSCLHKETEIITEDMETMYLLQGEETKSFGELLLHDGGEHFVVLSEAIFCLGETEVTLSPMSCVFVPDNLEVSYYEYESGSYVTYNTKGKQAMLRLKNDAVVYLYDRMIEYSDGTLDLLLNDPLLLPALQ